MRTLLALAGWPEAVTPPGAWLDVDPLRGLLALAHLGPEAAAPPPVATNETRSVYAVLAGSVYNRRELRASLGRHAFASRDDAEVVVHLYEERGVQCVNALRGPFALALWDTRRRRLLLARDQLGLLPLYYAADGGRVAAASSLAALAALPGVARSWDAAALDAFLVLGTVPPPATLYPSVRQLHPGEAVTWEDGRLRSQRYWQLAFPERRLAPDVSGRMLRGQLLEALTLRQAGAVSGLLLSGGLGAAGLLALAGAGQRPPTRAYTALWAGDADEESRLAARLAQRAGVEHVPVPVAPDWPAEVDALVAAHGGPLAGPEAILVRTLARHAAGDVEVALAGLGGEAVFGGSAPVQAAERIRRYRLLPALAREGAEVWARLAPRAWSRGVQRLVHDERLAPVEMYARSVSLFLPDERGELYTPEAFEAVDEARPWAALTALFAEAVAAGASEAADAMHYVELALQLPRDAAAAIACPGAELRLPLADHRLAQFVASVPANGRGSARLGQLCLREALADLLPQTVLRRPHETPLPPVLGLASWQALLEESLAPERLAAGGIFRVDTVERLRREHRSGRRDHALRLWRIVLATRWLERHAAPVERSLRAAG